VHSSTVLSCTPDYEVIPTELKRHATNPPFVPIIKPGFKCVSELMRSDTVPSSGTAKILTSLQVWAKVLRNSWCGVSKVYELPSYEQTVHTGIFRHILRICLTCLEAMVRIDLNPLVLDSMINVVSIKLLNTSVQNWPLGKKPGILPI